MIFLFLDNLLNTFFNYPEIVLFISRLIYLWYIFFYLKIIFYLEVIIFCRTTTTKLFWKYPLPLATAAPVRWPRETSKKGAPHYFSWPLVHASSISNKSWVSVRSHNSHKLHHLLSPLNIPTRELRKQRKFKDKEIPEQFYRGTLKFYPPLWRALLGTDHYKSCGGGGRQKNPYMKNSREK